MDTNIKSEIQAIRDKCNDYANSAANRAMEETIGAQTRESYYLRGFSQGLAVADKDAAAYLAVIVSHLDILLRVY